MLQNVEIENPKAIEGIIQEFGKLPVAPMSNFVANSLAQLLARKEFKMPPSQKPFLMQVIEKRIKHCFTYSIKDEKLTFFLAIISERVGIAIVYLWYLQFWCFKNDVREITIDIFCTQIFPKGFPHIDDIHGIWDAQKVAREGTSSDNLLDYAKAGESIQFK